MLPSKPGTMLYHAVETSIVDTFRATITDELMQRNYRYISLGHCLDSNYERWLLYLLWGRLHTGRCLPKII